MRPFQTMGFSRRMQLFEKQREETLLRFLDQLNTRDAVLNYAQIQGLLYAMACSPEPIKPAEWFELVWLNDDPQFENAVEAKRFYQLLVELFGAITTEVARDRFQLCQLAAGRVDATGLADWCDGFLLGHHYLEEIWDAALDDLDDDKLFEAVDETLDCAMRFVTADMADCDDEALLMTELIRFQQLLHDYCHIHTQCRPGQMLWSAERMFVEMEPAARGETCPCGSGRLFEHCCLH